MITQNLIVGSSTSCTSLVSTSTAFALAVGSILIEKHAASFSFGAKKTRTLDCYLFLEIQLSRIFMFRRSVSDFFCLRWTLVAQD